MPDIGAKRQHKYRHKQKTHGNYSLHQHEFLFKKLGNVKDDYSFRKYMKIYKKLDKKQKEEYHKKSLKQIRKRTFQYDNEIKSNRFDAEDEKTRKEWNKIEEDEQNPTTIEDVGESEG